MKNGKLNIDKRKNETSRTDNNEKDYKINNYLKSSQKGSNLKNSYNSIYSKESKISQFERDKKRELYMFRNIFGK